MMHVTYWYRAVLCWLQIDACQGIGTSDMWWNSLCKMSLCCSNLAILPQLLISAAVFVALTSKMVRDMNICTIRLHQSRAMRTGANKVGKVTARVPLGRTNTSATKIYLFEVQMAKVCLS